MALPLPMPPPARQTTRVRTPLFLVGVGLALVAFIAMFAFGILFASRSSDGAKVPVVVALDDTALRACIAREPRVAGRIQVTGQNAIACSTARGAMHSTQCGF